MADIAQEWLTSYHISAKLAKLSQLGGHDLGVNLANFGKGGSEVERIRAALPPSIVPELSFGRNFDANPLVPDMLGPLVPLSRGGPAPACCRSLARRRSRPLEACALLPFLPHTELASVPLRWRRLPGSRRAHRHRRLVRRPAGPPHPRPLRRLPLSLPPCGRGGVFVPLYFSPPAPFMTFRDLAFTFDFSPFMFCLSGPRHRKAEHQRLPVLPVHREDRMVGRQARRLRVRHGGDGHREEDRVRRLVQRQDGAAGGHCGLWPALLSRPSAGDSI